MATVSRRGDRTTASLDGVARRIEAVQLTIGISTKLLGDPWFGERARIRIIEGERELLALEAERTSRLDGASTLEPVLAEAKAA
jgi:hypothetical protein